MKYYPIKKQSGIKVKTFNYKGTYKGTKDLSNLKQYEDWILYNGDYAIVDNVFEANGKYLLQIDDGNYERIVPAELVA